MPYLWRQGFAGFEILCPPAHERVDGIDAVYQMPFCSQAVLILKINLIRVTIFVRVMKPVQLLNSTQLDITITRLCHQLIENHGDFSATAIIGLQPRGVYLADRIVKRLKAMTGVDDIRHGTLDITFHRDDFRRKASPPVPGETRINFEIEDLRIVLVDDVLYTGRTIRAGLDALLAFGRPERVELLVLIDRRFSRHLPVQPDYTGRTVDTISTERVAVDWTETEGTDRVTLYSTNDRQ